MLIQVDIKALAWSSFVSFVIVQFSDELSKIWRYYDAFLTQTEMLHIGPFQELANSFVNLKVTH